MAVEFSEHDELFVVRIENGGVVRCCSGSGEWPVNRAALRRLDNINTTSSGIAAGWLWSPATWVLLLLDNLHFESRCNIRKALDGVSGFPAGLSGQDDFNADARSL
jgi:hypothetical protein